MKSLADIKEGDPKQQRGLTTELEQKPCAGIEKVTQTIPVIAFPLL